MHLPTLGRRRARSERGGEGGRERDGLESFIDEGVFCYDTHQRYQPTDGVKFLEALVTAEPQQRLLRLYPRLARHPVTERQRSPSVTAEAGTAVWGRCLPGRFLRRRPCKRSA